MKKDAENNPSVEDIFKMLRRPGVTADEVYGKGRKSPADQSIKEKQTAQDRVAEVLEGIEGVVGVKSMTGEDTQTWVKSYLHVGLNPDVLGLSIGSVNVYVTPTRKAAKRFLRDVQTRLDLSFSEVKTFFRSRQRIVLAGEQDAVGIEIQFFNELGKVDAFHRAQEQNPQ